MVKATFHFLQCGRRHLPEQEKAGRRHLPNCSRQQTAPSLNCSRQTAPSLNCSRQTAPSLNCSLQTAPSLHELQPADYALPELQPVDGALPELQLAADSISLNYTFPPTEPDSSPHLPVTPVSSEYRHPQKYASRVPVFT